MLRVTKRAEFVFKILDKWATYEPRRLQHFLENGSELRLELLVWGDQIQK
jgi:hypothetical protein